MKSGLGLTRTGEITHAKKNCLGILLLTVFLFWCGFAHAEITLTVTGPGGSASQSLPDEGGAFDVGLPLNRNAVNNIVVTAEDAGGNSASATLAVTQVSLDQIVVSKVTSERLSVEEVEQLVADGVIDLEDPENYNVSTFDIVLTIDKQPVNVSIPVAVPIAEEKETGFETYKMPRGGGSGGNKPKTPDVQIVVFQESVPSTSGGVSVPPIPGVIIIEGNIRSLKEFFSVRLLLMNTSGIFTLSDVTAEIELPEGALSNVLPADGINSFGDILPGDGDAPGQKEMEFIIRGDEIGIHDVTVSFGGTVTGPGIDEIIPFNGSAVTEVEVKGPPTFLVEVTHPDEVVAWEPYELQVDITNTGDLTAMYASLELDVGADAKLFRCEQVGAGDPVCDYETGSEIRPFGHIEPGETVRETFTVMPYSTGKISSCVAAADQNITLNVYMGVQGCLVGHYPPKVNAHDGIPTVTVVPAANTTGVHEDTAVTAFFSEVMNEGTITTGDTGTFNVFDSAGERVPGALRFTTLFEGTDNEKTIAIWQVNDGVTNTLESKAEYTVVVTTDILDADGNSLANRWESSFTTTDTGLNDTTPPQVSMTVAPPVSPNAVLPGQIININAYAADAGSGISRVEMRLKDLDDPEGSWELVGQKTVFQGDTPPFIFAVDSGSLTAGHTHQAQATAYDGMGNAQSTTLALVILESADPPTVTLPDDPEDPVLQGISISLTPVLTGGVRRVEYYLDGASSPYKTVSLTPFKATLSTLPLSIDDHVVTVTAVDGLGQTGSAQYAFTLAENSNMPVVGFSNVVDGAVYETGASILIVGTAEDPVGIKSITYWLDDTGSTPLYSGFSPISLNTSGIQTGNHTIYIQAENVLDIGSDLADPAAAFEFSLVEPLSGEPPDAPTISIGFSESGLVSVSGSTVSGAKIVITNTDMGISTTVYANALGNFTGQVPGEEGNAISVVAYDLTASTDPSAPASGVVPAAPVLSTITVSPTTMTFDTAGTWQDITVTGHYESGDTVNLTSQAGFTTSDASVATVSTSGRVVARAYGDATITATVEGFSAQAVVNANIITLTGIEVMPSPVSMIFIGETESLTVTGIYSDGSQALLSTGLTYATGNPAVATVDSAGQVTAAGDGETQIHVAYPGVAAVSVPVTVDFSQDTPPEILILSPADNKTVEKGDLVSVSVQATDAVGGVTGLYIETTGETLYSDYYQVAPPALSTTRSFAFTISNAAAVGGVIPVTVWAVDGSGNTSTVSEITLQVVDNTAPSVTIVQPDQQAAFNFGDTVEIVIEAEDTSDLNEIRFETIGPIGESGSQTISHTQSASVTFSFVIPFGLTDPQLKINAYATDVYGNEGAAIPVTVILTDADITPPETVAVDAADPGDTSTTVITYEVTDGMDDLDHVEIYFRRNGIGTFSRYTNADAGNPEGYFYPQDGNQGTLVFDSEKMGGDGDYEFFTVGVDIAGNREPATDDGNGAVLPDQTAVFAEVTVWRVIDASMTVDAADTTYEDQNLRITGPGVIVTMNGVHSFKNVEILDGAMLTHGETDLSTEYSLNIQAWTFTVDDISAVNIDGRGYVGGRHDGAHDVGMTEGNISGATYRSGGSYGGLGGIFDGTPNPVYGNMTAPESLGSGGSRGYYTSQLGGDGGGRFKLETINFISDGLISANGLNGGGGQAGSGSGGSLYIVSSTLSGEGMIRADGGSSEVGGGGGRIAVYYIDISFLDSSAIRALGGSGSYARGGNGTVFLKGIGETNGTLVVDGQGGSTAFSTLPIPPGYIFDNVILRNSARVVADNPIVVNDSLQVLTGSILTHSQGSEDGLVLDIGTLIVDETSRIDVTGKGYNGGRRDGNSADYGLTLGSLPGANYRSGGSYGGYGGVYDGPGSNAPYGHPNAPVYLGSGGSRGYYGSQLGGNGGGRVTIVARLGVEIEGSILANGQTGGGGQAGSGSGGSIYIETSKLSGAGYISADGGIGEVGGGGGRIAAVYDYLGTDDDDLNGLRNITAFGGHGSYNWGSAGTVLFLEKEQPDLRRSLYR